MLEQVPLPLLEMTTIVRVVQPGTSWETGDILWDGKQCEGIEGPCCNNHPRLPWFTKDLKMHTLADIDVRLCISDRAVNLNVGIESLEFYVK